MLLFTRCRLAGVVALLFASVNFAADPAAIIRRVSSGVEARKTGDLKTAAAELEQAMKEAEESADDKLQALASLELAQLRHDEFDSAVAVKLYEMGVEKAAAGYGRDSLEYASASHNYAQLLSDLGEYAKARPLLERAVRDVPPESATPAQRHVFLMTLGTLCRREGDLEAAVKHYAEVLTGIEKGRTTDPVIAAALCLNLGVTFAHGEQLGAAEQTLKKALSLLGDLKASETPQVAACFNALSRVKLKQGDIAAAGEWAAKSVTICERRCGETHPHTASAVESLAESQLAAGKTKEASAGFKRVLQIREAKFGKDHPLVAEAVVRSGRAEIASGRCEEGAEQVERGYQLLAKRFGNSIPAEYLWVAEAYVDSLRGAKREEEARRILAAVRKSTPLK
jgi:tetratricopeptide (TPR) repeat protein